MTTKARVVRYQPKEPNRTGRIKQVEVTRRRPDGSRDLVAVTKTLRGAENLRDLFGRSRK